jgi:hypothetical protein
MNLIPLVLVFLGDGHHEPQVAAHQLVERFLTSRSDALREGHLVLARNQRILADLSQVLIERSLVKRRFPHGTHAHAHGQPRAG